MLTKIDSFENEFAFLSNFYPCHINYEGIDYPSVEHAFQAAKTLDIEHRIAISEAPTPGKAKRMGRALNLRADWEQIKNSVMEELVRRKFQDRSLAIQLWSTGEKELIEGNWWNDTYWGVCNGIGSNHLGKILMKIRAELKIKAQLIIAIENDLKEN